MWYWLVKIEGILLLPLSVIYYVLRGIPFTLRCKKCRRWLSDPGFLSTGICENCHRRRLSDILVYFEEQYRNEEATAPAKIAQGIFYRTFEKVVKRVNHGRVLDVGCGRGYVLSRLNLEPESLYGLDPTPGLLRVAKSWVEGGNFCLADARSIPFRSESFDYLTCTYVLQVIEGNEAVLECYRVLKPGGIALFIVPNGNGTHGTRFSSTIRSFTFKSIINLLKTAGFEIVSGQKFGLYIPFVCRFIGAVDNARGRFQPFTPLLNLGVPEFLATTFFLECRKLAS